MFPGHFEVLRNGVNKRLDTKRMFALYRIPSPWLPWYRKGIASSCDRNIRECIGCYADLS